MPKDSLQNQIAEWRQRAKEARANAEAMTGNETRAIFERIADSYDRMANSVEADLVELEREET